MESIIKESLSTLNSPNVINSNEIFLKLYSMIAKSKHFKLKDLADTLNCDVNNLKLTFKSKKKEKRQTSLRGKELQKFNIELFSIRTTTQPRKPVKTVSSEIKEIEKTSEIQVIKAKFEDVSNKLTKTEKLLSNLKLKNKQCIIKIKTSNTTILKKRQEVDKNMW